MLFLFRFRNFTNWTRKEVDRIWILGNCETSQLSWRHFNDKCMVAIFNSAPSGLGPDSYNHSANSPFVQRWATLQTTVWPSLGTLLPQSPLYFSTESVLGYNNFYFYNNHMC